MGNPERMSVDKDKIANSEEVQRAKIHELIALVSRMCLSDLDRELENHLKNPSSCTTPKWSDKDLV